MRQTGGGRTQAMAMRSCASNADSKDDVPTIQSTEPTAAAETPFSPLLSLLTSRECVPGLLECEKAVLVTKEHDYDRVPERCELAQLTPTVLRNTTEPDVERAVQALERATGNMSSAPDTRRRSQRRQESSVKNALLDCQQMLLSTRQKLLQPDNDSVSGHLRQLVGLQASVIHDLQDRLHSRDVELGTVRRDKEQLQAKLDRMERRLNILQRRSRDTDDAQDDDTPCHTPEQSHSRHARHERLVRVVQSESSHHGRRHSRSRSSSADPPKGLRSKSGHTPQNSLEVSLRAPSKRLSEDHTHNHTLNKKSRTSKTAEDPLLVIASGYHGLGLQLPHTHTKCAADKDKESEAARKTDIKVPSWKEKKVPSTQHLPRNSTVTDHEDLSDEVFMKRHHKLEQDERRRKRWDAQRIREKYHHDQLLKKYMMKEGSLPSQDKKKEKIESLAPKLNDLETILLSNTVVVSAFGRPVPVIPPSPFTVPVSDFSEEGECLRLTRNRSRNRLSTNGSMGSES